MIHKTSYILILSVVVKLCQGFYLPGVAPTNYEKNDKVPLLVNSLTSNYWWHSSSSYDYYYKGFGFCQPDGGPKKQGESLGSILFGDRIFNSPFELYMLKDESCKFLCTADYNKDQASFLVNRIEDRFSQNWLIDGLPAAEDISEPLEEPRYSAGFLLGDMFFDEEGGTDVITRANRLTIFEPKYILNNHYEIKIEYHKTKLGQYRVVGVTVVPSSRNNARPEDPLQPQCDSSEKKQIEKNTPLQVTYTYSVEWIESDLVWATRWDRLLSDSYPDIHWFSLVNSIIIVFLLVGCVFAILIRALRKDIAKYNQADLSDDIQEDSGWKLVHGDVFRSPKNIMIFSIFVGSGMQLFTMFFVTLIFAILGFLSPSNRGALATVMILLYAIFGFFGGYVSSRVYKTFGGESWKFNLILTPLLVPAIVFGTFFLLNFFLIFSQSSGAVPFGTMVVLVLIWFAVSVPLSFFGGFLGFKREGLKAPLRTNQIPRQIPVQSIFLRTVPSVIVAGIFPFVVISVELYFIINSLWSHLFYYMFGFLFICYVLMIIASASTSVLLTYFELCAENYHWQWRSIFLSGASAFYVFGFSLFYLLFKLSMATFTSVVLYIGYSLLISFIVFLTTGTIGFLCTFIFVRKIYGSIKVD